MTQTRIVTAETFDAIFEKYTHEDIQTANIVYYPLGKGKFMVLKNRYGRHGIKPELELNELLEEAEFIENNID